MLMTGLFEVPNDPIMTDGETPDILHIKCDCIKVCYHKYEVEMKPATDNTTLIQQHLFHWPLSRKLGKPIP